MSQRKRSKKHKCSQITDGEDDSVPAETQRRSQDQVNQKVNELVRFMLVKDQKKIPIKRADMLNIVIREYRDAYSEIINKADRTLREVFGLRVVEIDTKRHIYILINNLPNPEGQYLCRGKDKEKMGLLLVILSFIFMKGSSVKDGALWEFLHLLHVYPGKQHSVFGDVRKLVTEEFVEQKYLEITPIPLTDPPEFLYRWGPRAEKETSKKDVLNFVAKVQNKDPTFWPSQYREAVASQ